MVVMFFGSIAALILLGFASMAFGWRSAQVVSGALLGSLGLGTLIVGDAMLASTAFLALGLIFVLLAFLRRSG